VISLDHTQAHITVGRTPLDEGSARRRDLYLTTHKHSQETNIHARGGLRTHDPSNRSAADVRLRPRGHWDRQFGALVHIFTKMSFDSAIHFSASIFFFRVIPVLNSEIMFLRYL
jgi:hypothetical protein